MAKNYSKTLEELDVLIRSGKADLAGTRLKKLPLKQVPSQSRLELAAIARRCNQPLAALKLLTPFLEHPTNHTKWVLARAKTEYAGSLTRMGGMQLSLLILKEVNAKDWHEKLFIESLGLFTQWRYKEAIPLLRQYLSGKELSTYQTLVAHLNLGAALVEEGELREGITLLTKVATQCVSPEHKLLKSSALQSLTQSHIDLKNWKAAERDIEESVSCLQGFNHPDVLFAEKWKLFLSIRRDGLNKEYSKELSAFRAKAAKMGHWETVRSCDLEMAIHTKDKNLFWFIYFGTPHAALRNKMLFRFGEKLSVPAFYDWNINGKGGPTYDLLAEGASTKGKPLKAGSVPHKVLLTLSSDFYRPFRPAHAFVNVFEGEFFNPVRSNHKIYQSVYELRNWLKRNGTHLQIEEKQDMYRITAKSPCTLRVYSDPSKLTHENLSLEKLRSHFGMKAFTCQEASDLLGVSLRSVLTIIGENFHAIEKHSASWATRYRIKC